MPPRKRPRRSSPDLEATARRSSRPNHGVGGHAAQLQKVGEMIAASGRKGPKGDDLQISSSEENPMFSSQLQKGKKKPPAKPCSAPKKTQNEYRSTESSQRSQDPTSHPNLHVARSFERFRFKESQSNGRKRASERQPVQKEPQSSGHKTVGRNASQQDAGHEKELTDSDCEKDRQNADEHRELMPIIHELDEFDDDADFNDYFDHDMQMDRDDGQRTEDDTGDFDENGGRALSDGEARGDIDLGDELTDTEQDEAYDVLERHHAKNRQRKAPSPTYLFKGNGKEHAYLGNALPHTSGAQNHMDFLLFNLTPEDTHQSGNSKCKVKTTQENPSKLGFYPPTWQAFLQIVKLEMWLQAILAHPIPECQDALNLALLSTIRHTDGPTELKKIVISIVTTAATKLIKSGDYLRLPDSSGGKYKNFTIQALKYACLKFYYSNSKKALKNTNEFCQTIPINAMLLVAAVLKGVISGFHETGTDKVPDLTAEQCRIHFNNLRRSVDTLFNIPERREELEDMLEQWARVGMGDSEYATGSVSGSDAEDINIIL
ncbi:hypothetical protein P692DRAFT_201803875 [Suillus brevipes Sb2]|nr:hypothetical protein P692DRAFT_201803875 [Suillus brevipes Sb2]